MFIQCIWFVVLLFFEFKNMYITYTTASLASFWYLYCQLSKYFKPFSNASIVDFDDAFTGFQIRCEMKTFDIIEFLLWIGYSSTCFRSFKNCYFFLEFSTATVTMKAVQILWVFKEALSDLTQFLATESPLKMMKNAFYFALKTHHVLKIFKFLFWFFGHVKKRLVKKDKVNFKIYEVATWDISNCDIHIAQYLKK